MKPSIPKGTRDLSPLEMARRQYILDIIRNTFRRYGFQPLETPAMENSETLLGKYGDEGDRLIFKILNSGDWTTGISEQARNEEIKEAIEPFVGSLTELSSELVQNLKGLVKRYIKTRDISEKALRYDLTVPFARYVVMHQNEITFPFKRYQIQPVWRADRPQKGRYREFYQCDADVIGSKSLLNEVELIMLLIDVFKELGLEVQIKLNDRRLLQGLLDLFRIEGSLIQFVTILDKFDKIGFDGVIEEYRKAGYSDEIVTSIENFLRKLQVANDFGTYWKEFAEKLKKDLGSIGSQVGIEGIDSITSIIDRVHALDQHHSVTIDFALARGLDYYTGAIIEVKASEGTLQSSICGGGRYDDLTGIFGLKGMSGVGISFGLDRIYDVLLETGKFPADLEQGPKLLFANFGEKEALHSLQLLRKVREAGFAAELYPDQAKMAKQFKYANDRKIPFVAIIGENEMKIGIITVKDMRSGEQKAVKEDELIGLLQ